MVAEEQRQWAQARDYILMDLGITAEDHDEHRLNITLDSLARLWQASGDASLPGAIAPFLDVTPEAVEELLRRLSADGEG